VEDLGKLSLIPFLNLTLEKPAKPSTLIINGPIPHKDKEEPDKLKEPD